MDILLHQKQMCGEHKCVDFRGTKILHAAQGGLKKTVKEKYVDFMVNLPPCLEARVSCICTLEFESLFPVRNI